MGTWLTILLVFALVAVFVMVVSLTCSGILLLCARRYTKKQYEEDRNTVREMLPQTDCRECGLDSCMAYAEKTAADTAFPALCPHMRQEDRTKMEEYFLARKKELADRRKTNERQT